MGYGAAPVIVDINLDVRAGEFFGLIGLNGEGKTTLIKAILGLRRPEKGGVRLFGHDCEHLESKKNLAYLPERFEPPWFLSGMEFLRFSLSLYNRPFDEEQIIDAAEKLALDPAALKRRVQTYSKGMRQKLGLLGTILTGCGLLVLDEPMSGLDPKARALVKDMLATCKNNNQAVFLCSHILADMDEICDRVAVLHAGAVRFVGPPAELRKQAGVENLERAFLQFIEKKAAA